MVALDHRRALLRQAGNDLQAGDRIGALTDEVAEEDEPPGALAAGVGQAGLQGLEVAVDVGQQGGAHGAIMPEPAGRVDAGQGAQVGLCFEP